MRYRPIPDVLTEAWRYGRTTRRGLFASGLSLGVAGLVARTGHAAMPDVGHVMTPALFLLESGIVGGDALRSPMEAARIRVVEFAGDVGGPWLDDVQPLWRCGPVPVAGFTGHGARFCLEQLGRSAGLASTYDRIYPARRSEADAPIWSVAPQMLRSSTVEAPPAVRSVAAGWASAWVLRPVAAGGVPPSLCLLRPGRPR